MDPLSMSARISGLISILSFIAGRSCKYVKSARRSVQEVKKLVDEMTNLYGILNQLRLVVSRFDDESIPSITQSQNIDACRTLLNKIEERLDKADPSHLKSQNRVLTGKISTLGRALYWPFNVSETKALIDDIRTQKPTFMLGLQVDEMNMLLDALGDRKSQGLEIEAIHKKQKEIIKWIAPYDPSQRHQEVATKLRQPGTGQWFFKGDQFSYWWSSKASRLWLYGIRLAFFYCDYKDPRTHDPLNILGSLVKQLALADRRGFAELENYWVDHCPNKDIGPSSRISAEQLCHLLQDISRYFDNVHLVIDALDECGDSRSNTARILAKLNASKDSNVKIILTSRPEPDIEQYLAGFARVPISAHRNDLELYVHSEMQRREDNDLLFIEDQKLKEELAQRLVNEAQGMLSVNPSDKKMDRDVIPAKKNILKRCSSLVRKTSEGGPFDTRIELAHFTVREFLLLKVLDDPYASYRMSQDYHNA
ncbi:hypothetical protein SS1G_12307 [Sclerotinia sclerotiorum 1980 UF-70]|uniref:Nephrocystin 3-like N-terminal domain-containing protein n=1 Tax=Sclerotinia sclerotiorum (strain ATCC 18683 / 1980 / Ss-1) TaxID=665079 RepID=A7F309_SCLS1|nr:hypothetical protein SS1G_12307 [Sclerotinia sclerotiorum 1980 UF-70]EDN96101.1 hypothetical protein SS1G_12307 [Sclerotinia sclerotiorum 1980 UF-70]